MAVRLSLPEIGSVVGESTEFERLLARPSEFERLLKMIPKTEFEKLLERPMIPRSAMDGGRTVTISGAKWLEFAGTGVVVLTGIFEAFKDGLAQYYDAEEFQQHLRDQWLSEGINLANDMKVLRDDDASAVQDAMIETDVTFKLEIKTMKQTNRKRAYRMATSRKNG